MQWYAHKISATTILHNFRQKTMYTFIISLKEHISAVTFCETDHHCQNTSLEQRDDNSVGKVRQTRCQKHNVNYLLSTCIYVFTDESGFFWFSIYWTFCVYRNTSEHGSIYEINVQMYTSLYTCDKAFDADEIRNITKRLEMKVKQWCRIIHTMI